MKKFIILLFLTSCTSINLNNNTNIKKIDFNRDLTYDEFKILLINYTKNVQYLSLSN